MKRTSILTLALILVVAVGAAVAKSPAAKPTTIEGTLVDTKCYFADAANRGNDHGPVKGCGTICAKAGSPVGILTTAGKHYALVVPAPAVAEFVGQTVRATGTVREGSFVPTKLEAKKGNNWQEIKLGGSM